MHMQTQITIQRFKMVMVCSLIWWKLKLQFSFQSKEINIKTNNNTILKDPIALVTIDFMPLPSNMPFTN